MCDEALKPLRPIQCQTVLGVQSTEECLINGHLYIICIMTIFYSLSPFYAFYGLTLTMH